MNGINMNIDNKKNKKPNKELIIKIIILIVLLGIIIGIEFVYRNKLFNKSINIEVNLQNDFSKGVINFFKIITYFGTEYVFLVLFLIIFLFYPLNYSFLFISTLMFVSYFINLLKMFYHNPRPFWVDSEINYACNSGFGNPSGHSFSSTSIYMIFAHLITNYEFFKKDIKGKIIRILIFFLFLCLVITVIFSRIVLGAHSINQVLYGGLLGFIIYYVSIYIIQYQNYSYKDFYEHFNKKLTIIIYSIIYLVLIIIDIITYFSIDEGNTNDYLKMYLEKCKERKKYKMFLNDGFHQTFTLFGSIGAQYGLLLLFYLIKKSYGNVDEYIITWNHTGPKKFFIRLPILIVSLVFLLLYLFVPGDILAIAFIFKVAISFLFATFGLFCFGIYFSIISKNANEKIYNLPI